MSDLAGTRGDRHVGLDALRVLAAIGVAVTHVAFSTGVVNPDRWDSPLRWFLPRLDVGVSVFFVLSAMLVSRPFVAAALGVGTRVSVRDFAIKRAVRIFPLYWIVLGVTLATAPEVPGPARLIADMFLVHIYRPQWAIGPITQSWTLATELSFYALVPLWFAWWGRRFERRQLHDAGRRATVLARSLLGWVVIAAVFRVGALALTDPFVVGGGATDTRGALLTWLPNYLDHFALGVLLAIWQVAGWPRMTRTMQALAGLTALVALALVSLALDLPPYFTGFNAMQTVLRHALNLVIAGSAVAAVALGAARSPATTTPTTTRSLVLRRAVTGGGMASYGIYLWHQWVTERWLEHVDVAVFTAAFPTALFVVLGISAALALAGHRWIERPALAAADPRLRWVGAPRVLGSLPALDGLRGAAILAVLATHIVFLDNGRERFALAGGFLGVDVFLSLSGFLIAATLLREVDASNELDLGRYVARRARRLVPPLVVFLAIHFVVAAALGDPLGEQLYQTVLSLGFVSNWQLSWGHQPPFDLVHLWSLAVEGQLYLLCGIGLWWARRHLDRVRLLLVTLGAAVVVVATWRIVATRAGGDLQALYQRTDLRADALFVGVAAAVAWRARLVPDRVAATAGTAAGGALILAMILAGPNDRWLFLWGFTAIAVAAATVVLAGAQHAGPVAAVAEFAPLRWFGRISYSLYLWHLPIYLWVVRGLGQDASLAVKAAIAIPASVVAGWLGHRLVETRSARRPSRSDQLSPHDDNDTPSAVVST